MITEVQNPEHRRSTFNSTNMFVQPIKSAMTTSIHIVSKSTFKVTLQSMTSKLCNQKSNRTTNTITTYLSSESFAYGIDMFRHLCSLNTNHTKEHINHKHPLLHSKLFALLPLPWQVTKCSPVVNPTKVVYRHHNGTADGVSGFKPATFQWILDARKQKELSRCKVWTVLRM
jgi:hypothetical protein